MASQDASQYMLGHDFVAQTGSATCIGPGSEYFHGSSFGAQLVHVEKGSEYSAALACNWHDLSGMHGAQSFLRSQQHDSLPQVMQTHHITSSSSFPLNTIGDPLDASNSWCYSQGGWVGQAGGEGGAFDHGQQKQQKPLYRPMNKDVFPAQVHDFQQPQHQNQRLEKVISQGQREDALISEGIASAVADFLASADEESACKEPQTGVSSPCSEGQGAWSSPGDSSAAHSCQNFCSNSLVDSTLIPSGVATEASTSVTSSDVKAPHSAAIPEAIRRQVELVRGERITKFMCSRPRPVFAHIDSIDLKNRIVASVHSLLGHGRRSTARAIGKDLHEIARADSTIISAAAEEFASINAEMVLTICAHESSSFRIWVDFDAEVCILVLDTTILMQVRALESLCDLAAEGRDRSDVDRFDFTTALVHVVNSKITCSAAQPLPQPNNAPPQKSENSVTNEAAAVALETPMQAMLPHPPGLTLSELSRCAPCFTPAHFSTFPAQHGLSGATSEMAVAANLATPGTAVVDSEQKEFPSARKHAEHLEAKGVTTVMVRNIPPSVSQHDFVAELESSGFGGIFDFCYMPTTFNTRVSMGYAFVNFISPAAVKAFAMHWHHRPRRFSPNGKLNPLDVTAAALQGREQNMRKLMRMSRIRNPALRPLMFDVHPTLEDWIQRLIMEPRMG